MNYGGWRTMESRIENKIEELLAKEYFCTIKELNTDGIFFTKNLSVTQSYIKMMAYRNVVIVCTSKNIFPRVKDLLKDKSRDEIFEFPFVYGQTIHYVPDADYTHEETKLREYDFQIFFGEEILSLQGLKGFDNSLAFDDAGCTPAKAAYIARHHKKIIGIS